jgi:hypothetical protein
LSPLIANCASLLAPRSGCLVLTGHSDMDPTTIDLDSPFIAAGHDIVGISSGRLELTDLAGRELDCGWYARVLV